MPPTDEARSRRAPRDKTTRMDAECGVLYMACCGLMDCIGLVGCLGLLGLTGLPPFAKRSESEGSRPLEGSVGVNCAPGLLISFSSCARRRSSCPMLCDMSCMW